MQKRKRGRPVGITPDMIEARAKQRMADRAAVVPPGPGNKLLRPERQEEVRAKIQASHIVRRLQQCGDGEIELTAQQVKAYQILLDKSVASLQATELTEVSKNDKLSEAEIMERIRAIVGANPSLASLVPVREVVDVGGDDTCDACGGEVASGVCVACGHMAGL